jgi:hypothetical protein
MPTESNGNTLVYRVGELEKDVIALQKELKEEIGELQRKVDRVMWSLVSLTVALTTTSIIVLLTKVSETNIT